MKTADIFRQIGFLAEAAFVIPLGTVTSLLPWGVGRRLSRLTGLALFGLVRHRLRWPYRNLDIIFSETHLAPKKKAAILRKLFANFAIAFFEYLKIGSITSVNFREFVDISDPETAEQTLDAMEKALVEHRGVIALSAHIGNWEMLASVGAKLGWNIAVIINRQRNPYTDRWLRYLREKKGKVKCIYNEIAGIPKAIRHLKANGVLAVVADERQSFQPIFAPFFGMESASPSGPAKLHLRYGSPIVFCFSIRQNTGKYLLTAEGPYHFSWSGDLQGGCREIMTQVHRKFETLIKKHPDQWFGLLKRRWGDPFQPDIQRVRWK